MTWGISGSQFLLIYAAALLAVIVETALLRRWLLHGSRGSAMVAQSPVSLDELAFLSGGAYGLGASALVGLREHGEVVSGRRRHVQASGRPLRPDATPAQRALHERLSRSHQTPVRRVGQLIAGSPVYLQVRRSLIERGLLTSAKVRSAARIATLGYVVLLVVGGLRVKAGISNARPITYLVMLMILTVVIWTYALRVPDVTRAGRILLRQARIDSDSLRSGSLPGDRAMAVALFGIGALWLAEPALATELGFARAQAVASGSDSASWSDTSSSCGGSSSSCSSSSCGGSSCGGGGCGG